MSVAVAVAASVKDDPKNDVNWGGAGVSGRSPARSTVIGSERMSRDSSDSDPSNAASLRKRDIVKGFLTRNPPLNPDTKVKKALAFMDWAKITGNHGNSTCGKALMYAMANDVRGDETGSESDDGSDVGGSKLSLQKLDSFAEELKKSPSPITPGPDTTEKEPVVKFGDPKDTEMDANLDTNPNPTFSKSSSSNLTSERTRTMTAAR